MVYRLIPNLLVFRLRGMEKKGQLGQVRTVVVVVVVEWDGCFAIIMMVLFWLDQPLPHGWRTTLTWVMGG